jgi:hypothetical protein
MNAGVMTLEFDATAPAISAANGMPIKGADATRTCVGLAITTGAAAWVNTTSARQVLSYWNRRSLLARFPLTSGSISTSSGAPAELSATYRVIVAAWNTEVVQLAQAGSIEISAVNTGALYLTSISGIFGALATLNGTFAYSAVSANASANAAMSNSLEAPSDGLATIGMYASVNGGTLTVPGGAGANQACLQAITRG